MKKLFRKLYKSRTMIAATSISVLGAIQASTDALGAYMTKDAIGLLLMAIGVLMAYLRAITTTPLDSK